MLASHLRFTLALLVLSTGLQGAITYSGLQNLSVAANFGGLSLDFDDPNDASSFVVDPFGLNPVNTVPVPWDFNFFFGGAGIASSDTASPHTIGGSGPLAQAVNLVAGTFLATSDLFPSSFSGSLTHLGTDPGQFTSSAAGGPGGTEGYIGFLIDPSSFPDAASPPPGPMVGWIRVTLEDDGSVGVIHDWAWETTGSTIEVGVPEPATGLLITFAMFGLLRRRR